MPEIFEAKIKAEAKDSTPRGQGQGQYGYH